MKTLAKYLTLEALVIILALAITAAPAFAKNGPNDSTRKEDAAAAAAYVGKTFTLTTDHLYTASADKAQYDLVPVWSAEAATVTAVQVTANGYRFSVKTETGIEGYFEVASLGQVQAFLAAPGA
jgi:hypothetical protein